MKKLDFKLNDPVDGVSTLSLLQPGWKHRFFVLEVQSSFVNLVKNKDLMDIAERNKKSGNDDEDAVVDGKQLYTMLILAGADVHALLEKFTDLMLDQSICAVNGGPLPRSLLEKLSADEFIRLFQEYIGFFIKM